MNRGEVKDEINYMEKMKSEIRPSLIVLIDPDEKKIEENADKKRYDPLTGISYIEGSQEYSELGDIDIHNLNYKINNNRNVTDATAGRNLRAYPNNFVYSGGFYNSSAYNRGSSGVYWSSTASNSIVAYLLNFGSSYVDPGTGSNTKYRGYSVRCVLGS